jgi:hypothetical protein
VCTWWKKNQNNENRDIVKVIVKNFFERGAYANDEYTGGRHYKKLKPVGSIWAALGNVTFRKNASDIGKDKQLNLLDDALATLRLLNSTNNKTWVPCI